jgi:ubiquinone/menaquinone biosynthesis C-methylase UbiE
MTSSRHHAGVAALGFDLTPGQARTVYDRIGRAQDWQRFYEDAATTELVGHAAFERAEAVVELGCGTGWFAARLLAGHLPPAATYMGVDVSPRMVALASTRLAPWRGRVAVSLADAGERLPTPDASADRLVSNYVFDLLSPDATRAALDEAHRVLMPDGLLCVAGLTPGEHGFARLVSSAWKRVWMHRPVLVGGCRPIRIADALDAARWDIRHRRVVTAWGIASEAVIAGRR